MSKTNKIRFAKLDVKNLILEQEFLQGIQAKQIKKMIQQFASFLPDEILQNHGTFNQINLRKHFVGVLLCTNISGIFDLFDRYYEGKTTELYSINVHLNAYLGTIVEILCFYGGDILSIESSKIITMWKCLPDDCIPEKLHTVIVCANVLQRHLGSYKTDSPDPLKLKTVISCGNISYGIFGNTKVKKPIFLGDAFIAIHSLLRIDLPYNTIIVTSCSHPHMIEDRYKLAKSDQEYIIVSMISYTKRDIAVKTYFKEKYLNVAGLIKKHYKHRDALRHLVTSSTLFDNLKISTNFINSLPPRPQLTVAPQYWTVPDMAPLQNYVVFEQLSDSQPGEFLTEMKEVISVYVRVVPLSTFSRTLLVIVENIFEAIAMEVINYSCLVHNIGVETLKIGIMTCIVFGLIVANRDEEVAASLKLAETLKITLSQKDGVKSVSVGISSGKVFCSVIGHPLRRDYAIMGKPIVKSHQLAILAENKVLCDLKIFNSAKFSSLYFKLYKTLETDSEDCFIIEFSQQHDTTEDNLHLYSLIDRVSDFNLAVGMIQNPAKVGFSGICFNGTGKLGKTKLLMHLSQECQKYNCTTVCITLSEMLSIPYYCIKEIYRQIYDQMFTINTDISEADGLPRNLLTAIETEDVNEDVALQKYRTLNHFRDLVACATNTIVVCIDNLQYIDSLSWEIIELSFPCEYLRLIMTCSPHRLSKSLDTKLNDNVDIRVKELLPLKDRYIAPLACTMLQAQGISKRLIKLLILSCEGVPGHVQSLLLRLINNGSIFFDFNHLNQINVDKNYYVNIEELERSKVVFAVVQFSTRKAIETSKMTKQSIYQDIYNAMPTFLQIVVKCASLIGEQFGRQMLRLALNLPPENDLSLAIKILFDERVFICASLLMCQQRYDPSQIRCACCFEDDSTDHLELPRYAYCKLMQFHSETLQEIAYKHIPCNQRHELHVLCAEVLEKTEHICPSCMRNPSNYYVFFGSYESFMQFCIDPSAPISNYCSLAKDSYDNIKRVINAQVASFKAHPKEDNEKEESDTIISSDLENPPESSATIIDDKYVPYRRQYDASACYCLEILHMVYTDLIRHAYHASEPGKVIFYKLKLGMNQMSLRDIDGAMQTLHQTRELSLADCGKDQDRVMANFRKYHVGKASIGLAICNLKIKNVAGAKCNIMLALRQYNVPMLAFLFKHFRFLVKRNHFRLKTIRPYNKKKDAFGWELGTALFICAKVFALEHKWNIARDCCKCGISLMKANNNNMLMLFDTYADAINIYSMAGDAHTCERLQVYLIREFQLQYAQNETFSFHMLLDMLLIVIELYVAYGKLQEAIGLGYRFMHLAEGSNVLTLKPPLIMLLCELNIYNISFRNFIDLMALAKRHLSPDQKENYVYYYLMCMQCYNYTGFHVREFAEILLFADKYYKTIPLELSIAEKSLKLAIMIYLMKMQSFDKIATWRVQFDEKAIMGSTSRNIKFMLLQMEAYLLELLHSLKRNNELMEMYLKDLIRNLFIALKKVVSENIMYLPAYFALSAWYFMIKGKKSQGMRELKKMKQLAEKHRNILFQAFALRLKNHWQGGFVLKFDSRPHVSITEAPTYSFRQFAQFIHPYIFY